MTDYDGAMGQCRGAVGGSLNCLVPGAWL